MNKSAVLLFLVLFGLAFKSRAQQNPHGALVPDSVANEIIEQAEKIFPKFYHELMEIKQQDPLIQKFEFIDRAGIGPAFASPNGTVTLNLNFIKRAVPNFDDNRLIVVLYHEIGHLHYYQKIVQPNRSPENSEKAAFEYSLLKTKMLALKGDCLPLKAGVKFMKLRSESNELSDPHVRALKRMVNEPLYADYVKYVNENCK